MRGVFFMKKKELHKFWKSSNLFPCFTLAYQPSKSTTQFNKSRKSFLSGNIRKNAFLEFPENDNIERHVEEQKNIWLCY